MSARSPKTVGHDIARVQRALDELANEYRWAHEYCYGQGRSGERVGGRSAEHNDLSSTVGRREKDLASLEAAGDAVRLAATAIRKAESLLGFVRRGEGSDERARPRLIAPQELAEAQAAKRRREMRGEGIGV